MATKKDNVASKAKSTVPSVANVLPGNVRQFYFDHQKFVAAFEKRFAKLSPQQYSGLDALLGMLEVDPQLNRLSWYAYMLATTKHECADTWMPIIERGPTQYFDKYEPGTSLGAQLGNTQPGDGYLFRGRGFVQITGRANYAKLGVALGLGDALVKSPELALDSSTAYRIMSVGMIKGLFTGKAVGAFLNDVSTDYLNARKVINRLNEAERIKGYAEGIEAALSASLIS